MSEKDEKTCERCGATYFRNCVNCNWNGHTDEPDDLDRAEAGDAAYRMVRAWCDDFERVFRWLCAPEPTVTITVKEYERLKAGYGMGVIERGQQQSTGLAEYVARRLAQRNTAADR